MGPRPPGTTVFVGNISYDTTEEQLREYFSQVGKVVSFRLMYDHDTGRAKGFGFCEYEDKETAMSARRNLNGTMLNDRPLRVDLTESDKQNAALNGLNLNAAPAPKSAAMNVPSSTSLNSVLPPDLSGTNPSMAKMSLEDIHRTMLHLKKAVVHNPNEIREVLLAHPRLAQAILQGQIMLGMVPPPGPPMQTPPARPPPRAQPRPLPPRSQQVSRPMPPPSRMPPNMPRAPMPRPPQGGAPQPMPPQMAIPPRPMVAAGPPPQGAGSNSVPVGMMNPPQGMPGMRMGPPPPGGRMPPAIGAMPGIGGIQQPSQPDEQTAILRKVMTMTPQEIDALAPEHKGYVMQLKEIVARQNPGMGGMGPGMGPGAMAPGGMPPPGMPLPGMQGGMQGRMQGMQGGMQPGMTPPGMPAPGMQAPGMQAPGMPAPGMPAPGMPAPGMPAPGMPAPGMQAPGMQTPGMQAPGMQAPGMQAPGMQAQGMQGPGMQGPGMQGGLPPPPPQGALGGGMPVGGPQGQPPAGQAPPSQYR